MKERPILFSSPMVRAILDGRKTQTRRVVKTDILAHSGLAYVGHDHKQIVMRGLRSGNEFEFKNPYGVPDDRLWVREALRQEYTTGDPDTPNGCLATYHADGNVVFRDGRPAAYEWERDVLPSMFMPRWACRIVLEVTGVRVERVQDIVYGDVLAEGIEVPDGGMMHDARHLFRQLWDSINAKHGYGWDANPWVWALAFVEVEGMAAVPDSV